MTNFHDSNGAIRTIELTFRTLFQCADVTGFDLLNPANKIEGTEKILEQELLYNPGTIALILYGLCRFENETQDAFLDALDGRAFKDGEDAFWKEYQDFFVQSGRGWLADAILKDRQTVAIKNEAAKKRVEDFPLPTFSESSDSAEKKTGSTPPSGNSQDSPTRKTDSAPRTNPSSSAPSITPTSPEKKTSANRKTSTPTKS